MKLASPVTADADDQQTTSDIPSRRRVLAPMSYVDSTVVFCAWK